MSPEIPPNLPYRTFLEQLRTKLSGATAVAPGETLDADFEDIDWSDIQFGQPKTDEVPAEAEAKFKGMPLTNLVNDRAAFGNGAVS